MLSYNRKHSRKKCAFTFAAVYACSVMFVLVVRHLSSVSKNTLLSSVEIHISGVEIIIT